MASRQTFEKLKIQGNFYPITCAAYIEDEEWRLTLLAGQPHGFSALKQGFLTKLKTN